MKASVFLRQNPFASSSFLGRTLLQVFFRRYVYHFKHLNTTVSNRNTDTLFVRKSSLRADLPFLAFVSGTGAQPISKPEAIERQYVNLKSIIADVSLMRLGIEAKKLEAKEEMADILSWNAEVNAEVN